MYLKKFHEFQINESVFISFNYLMGSKHSKSPPTKYIENYIKNGGDLNFENSNGLTLLIYAIYVNRIDIVKLLIDAGSDLDKIPENGFTALMHAVSYGYSRIGIIELLIKSKADLNLQSIRIGSTALMCAAVSDTRLIKLLIDAGADEYITNNKGETFYDHLSSKGQETINKEYPNIGYQLSGYRGSFKEFLKESVSNSNIIIKELSKKEVDVAIELVQKSFSSFTKEEDPNFWIPRSVSSDKTPYPDKVLEVKYYLAIDEASKKVVGIVGHYTKEYDASECDWLAWFAVDPKYRKQGIGKKLLNFMIEKSKKRGKKFLRLYTSDAEEERDAQFLYDRLKFKIIKTEKIPDGYTLIYREKKLILL